MAYDKSLAHIEQIKTITPIVGADNIEMVSVLDWNIVAKKGEFKINDLALFIEVDSIVPDGVPDEKKDELKTLYDELSIAEKDKRLDIETKEKNLACNNIIWNDILIAMNIDTTAGDGIENVETESTFIVGPNPTATPLTQIDVTTWRTVKHNCVNLL